MVEHQIICKVLNDKSLKILFENGVDLELFPEDYKEELQYIVDHQAKYGNIPDTLSFLEHFPDFEVVQVTESDDYLIDRLMESILYQRQLVMANQYGELLGEEDSRNALSYLKNELEKLRKVEDKNAQAVDITKNVVRGDRYTERVKIEGITGIKTGSEELDRILHGWLEEDLVIILGRTNEGKSWILKFFLVVAWQAGHRVLMYSGEMNDEIVGYRFDTLNYHFSNDALMTGNKDLGDNLKEQDYVDYLGDLGKSDVPFMVITPKKLGRRLDVPTLRYLIEVYEPDIIGIDQISLMDDYRAGRGTPTRIQYTHLAEDLYSASEDFRVPILAPAQAKRDERNKKKKDEGKEIDPPYVEDIMESDGVGQNSTRVIAMKVNGVQLKLAVRKNRYGKKDDMVSFLWDIDRGIIKPFAGSKKATQPKQEGKKQPETEKPVGDVTSGEELF